MLCVIALIDPQAKMQLTALQEILNRDYQIPPRHLHGHITLLTYLGDNEAQFIRDCKAILKSQPAVSFTYDRISVFASASTVIAGAAKEGILAGMQAALASRFTENLDHWTKEGNWVPHTTLLYRPDSDLEVFADAMRAEFNPIPAAIRRIEFSRVCPGSFEIIDHIDLL